MLPRNFLEHLDSVGLIAILMLFVQFLRKVLFKILPLILSASANMTHFWGVPRSLKRRGAHFKAKLAGPDIVMSKKKDHHARRCPIFRPKSSEEQKKVITSADMSNFFFQR